jgi:hypothetical protein
MKIPNAKVPNAKKVPMNNFEMDFSTLGFLWRLEFGIWHFAARQLAIK